MVVSENNVILVRVLGLPDHILIALLEQNRAGVWIYPGVKLFLEFVFWT
jgi:hypothetical protein